MEQDSFQEVNRHLCLRLVETRNRLNESLLAMICSRENNYLNRIKSIWAALEVNIGLFLVPSSMWGMKAEGEKKLFSCG